MAGIITIKTPIELNMSAIDFEGHLLIRRTKRDKNGRRYSFGPFYDAKHECTGRYYRFSSSEIRFMRERLENEPNNLFPLRLNPCPAIGTIRYS